MNTNFEFLMKVAVYANFKFRPDNTVSHPNKTGNVRITEVIELQIYVLIFNGTFLSNIFCSKKGSATYCNDCTFQVVHPRRVCQITQHVFIVSTTLYINP